MKRKIRKIRVVVSNSSHMNWEVAHDFDVFDGDKLILSGTHEHNVERSGWVDTYDENGNFDGSYQESGDFSSGYTNYNILDSFNVTVNGKYVTYFPYKALKCLLKHFKADTIILNW